MNSIHKIVEKWHSQYTRNKERLLDVRYRYEKEQKRLKHITAAQEFTQQIAQHIQEHVHQEVAGIISLCLRSVFGPEYGFRIEFERKRGRTEAQLVLTKDGHDIGDPMAEDSGGVTDVASFALRLCCLLLAKPQRQRVLILDEPFKFVSRKYRPALVELIQRLADDFNVQFIIVTHMDELEIGKVVRL